jgi:putative PIN family toxin of toxin-antitoxin system
MIVVLDTNVVVQALIGSEASASSRAVRAIILNRIQVALSDDARRELAATLTHPKVRGRHQGSEHDVAGLLSALWSSAIDFHPDASEIRGVRDVTDRKFLALAQASAADFLVTNDRRHLLPLKRFGRTRIVTPAAFLRHLK